MFDRKYLASLLAIPVFAFPLAARATPTYSLTFLPETFTANDIGDSGEIVGSFGPFATHQAATWAGGTLTTYGTLGRVYAEFNAIGSNGLITGASSDISYSSAHALVYQSGILHDIGGLPDGTVGTGINSSGQVAGYTITASRFITEVPLLYSRGTMSELGTLFQGGRAAGINDAGIVVGEGAGLSGGYSHAFMYNSGVLTDLGTLGGGARSSAHAINTAGDIVGAAEDATYTAHAFLYSGGVMHDLGAFGGAAWANDINDSGQIVGAGFDGKHMYNRGLLYTDGEMVDLNSLTRPIAGWTVFDAKAINNAGQIIGTACTDHWTTCRDILLDPVTDPVPEPGTTALLLAGFGGLALSRRRRGRTPALAQALA